MNINDIINKGHNISITIKRDDLLDFGKCIATRTAQLMLDRKKDKLFTREEVLEKFNICSATLWRWTKNGLIGSQKIGNRRYYKETDIEKVLGEV